MKNNSFARISLNPNPGNSGRILPLFMLNQGDEGAILSIGKKDPARREKAIKSGIFLCDTVRVIRNDARNIIFSANSKEYAVDYETASDIYVRTKTE
jgi:hypothetical protein